MTPDEMALRAGFAGVARGLNLLPRMVQRFKMRGWPLDDRVHIAAGAVACVALQIPRRLWRVFPGTDDPKCWASITGTASAGRIVEALELQDMLRPEVITAPVM